MRIKLIAAISVLLSSQIVADNFKLVTVLYNEKNLDRVTEYLTCLEHNQNHKLIDTVHIIYDTSADDANNTLLHHLQSKKITISYINSRPSYGYCFDLANKLYPNNKIILSNADIYFNETLNSLVDYDLTGKFLALTRWNINKNGSLELFRQFYPDGKFHKYHSESSQDVWIFKTPLHIKKAHSIQPGLMHCDARIAYEALQSGLKVINPCLTIQCCHLHLINSRNYNPNNPEYKNQGWSTTEWTTT